jgi:phage terminase small subunit
MTKSRGIVKEPPQPATHEMGPAMQVLTEKQRKYVLALFEAPRSHGSGVFAARSAGYGTSSSSRQSIAQLAYQLNTDPKVQAAIAEVSKQYLTVLGPHAVRGLKKVLDNPAHRDFGRALGIVMDRVSPVQSTAVVKVEGEIKLSAGETAQVLERIEELARKFSVALPAPKVIDHEAAA